MKSLFKKLLSNSSSRQGEVLDESGNTLMTAAHEFSDTAEPIRRGFWIVGVSFAVFLLWASFAPLDSGTPTTGTLVVESRQKTIQHLSGGVIEQILVKEGDHVKEGQLLIKMLATVSDAQLGIIKNQAEQLQRKLIAVKPLVDEGYFPKLEFQELDRQAKEATLRLKVAVEELERTQVKSPIDGHVMGLSAVTVGGVIPPGGRLMGVIPEGDGLVVEAVIPPHLIDKVHAGSETDVRFSALNQRTTPVLTGKVVWVSADRFANPNSNLPVPVDGFFTARIELTAEELKRLDHQQLRAGMPVDVIVKTGSRTFMSYLLKPFIDRAALSLKEQ